MVLVSEPVGGRSRATELPCYFLKFLVMRYWTMVYFVVIGDWIFYFLVIGKFISWWWRFCSGVPWLYRQGSVKMINTASPGVLFVFDKVAPMPRTCMYCAIGKLWMQHLSEMTVGYAHIFCSRVSFSGFPRVYLIFISFQALLLWSFHWNDFNHSVKPFKS